MRSCSSLAVLLCLGAFLAPARADEVAIYTGTTQWITKALADEQAQISVDKLDALGISNTWLGSDLDMEALADWVTEATDNGELDVLVLYGDLPPTIYAQGNAEIDGSLAELFIESTDGDTIINHADYMFWGLAARNGEGGLQNIMDIPGIVMWDDNTPMVVTDEGKTIAPSLTDFLSDRPFHVDQLAGEWFVEVALAQNEAGTRADPIIVRDGDRGRLVPALQAADQVDPKGAVAAEIIAWLYGKDFGGATKLALSGSTAAFGGKLMSLNVQIQEATGSPKPRATDTTVNLLSDSTTGHFENAANATVTSLVIPAGETSAAFFYSDTAAGTHALTVSAAGLTSANLNVKTFAQSRAPAGEVAIYTGTTQWITKGLADEQAQITFDNLDGAGISTTWFQTDQDMLALADWVTEATGNGKLDVLVLYGDLVPDLYPQGNTMPDGSVAELFIESTDGDAIINHADYMFWGLAARNAEGGLQNMMDIPGIVMWDDNTPMVVTDEGRAIAPSLADFLTDRPFHTDQLAGDWLLEAALAQNATGTRVDPAIVRDGDRGRLIPVYQTADQADPKGAVASEIIFWLFGVDLSGPTELALSGPATGVTGLPIGFQVKLQATGSPRPSPTDVTVNLLSNSATGAFDTQRDGSFDGTVTSVVIPAGQLSGSFFYKETAEKIVTLSVASPGLDGANVQVNVLESLSVSAGEVVIYTGTTQWIAKPLADEQAQITADKLSEAGIVNAILPSDLDMQAVADWVQANTDNGKLDVLVLYGDLPPTIYAQGNLEPDGSLAELFIESPDGDAIINHADYMFWGLAARNGEGGLQNIMDIPGIVMWDDNTPMVATEEGKAIAPSLVDVLSDRPFHLDQLTNDWFPELILAQNAAGTRADPVIVRDGNRGRLIPVFQSADQIDPKGDVAAEIIIWLLQGSGPVTPVFHRGDADDNGALQLTDALRVLGFLFLGGPAPTCLDSGDADDNGALQLTDALGVLGFLFLGAAPPPSPGPPGNACGRDPTEDVLGCDLYTSC